MPSLDGIQAMGEVNKYVDAHPHLARTAGFCTIDDVELPVTVVRPVDPVEDWEEFSGELLYFIAEDGSAQWINSGVGGLLFESPKALDKGNLFSLFKIVIDHNKEFSPCESTE